MAREPCAPLEAISDHRATRRAVELAPADEEVIAEAAGHLTKHGAIMQQCEALQRQHEELLQQAAWHSERATELLAPLNRVAAYRHEAESVVDEALSESEEGER